MNKDYFIEKINNARELSFGDIFNESIELFKKVWLQGFVKLLLDAVMGILLMIVFQVPMFMLIGSFAVASEYVGDGSEPAMALPMLILVFGLMLIAIVAVGAVSMALMAGFYRICKMKDLNQAGKDDYFYYLKKEYFRTMATLVLATVGISIPAALLCYLPLFYVMVPISFFSVFFAFNPEMSASDIISVSFKLGTKKWGISIALILVTGILASFVGTLLCGIGILFTASFGYLPVYFIYKHVIGFDDDYRVNPDDMRHIGQ